MELNADFDKRALIHADELEWLSSPMPGVHRRMLDRVGDEVARATTLVRYAPSSHFSPHTHGGGEEFLVLDGVFQDEHGDYPAGSYLRNPPTSSHTPGSEPGCVIFVKLHQFDPADRLSLRVRADERPSAADPKRPGIRVTPLHVDSRESVGIESWDPNVATPLDTRGGLEILVLEGELQQGGDTLRRHSWLRLPSGPATEARAGATGARLWCKQGHLDHVDQDLAGL